MTDLEDFEIFLRTRERAAASFVNGDAGPLGRIVALRAPATFFGPGGGVLEGPGPVYTQYQDDAVRFAQGSSHFEVLHLHAAGGLAYWTGWQRASARMRGRDQQEPMDLRVTEVFRREGMEWKLVHRHADMLTQAREK